MTANNTTPKDALIALLDTLVGDDTHTPVSVKREGKENLIVVGEETYNRILSQALLYRDTLDTKMPGITEDDLLQGLANIKAPEDDA